MQQPVPATVGFRSAGVHRLELGTEVVNSSGSAGREKVAELRKPARQVTSTQQRVSFAERHAREQEELRAHGPNVLWPLRAISADNVGYSLLRKAGWQEGAGLGAAEQGRLTPIQAWLQKGNRGIGFDHKAAQERQAREQQRQNDASSNARKQAAAAQREAGEERKRRMGKIVEDELKAEDTGTKVKRYRQVQRQEEEDAERRALSRYLSQAFNNPLDNPHRTGDTNPLGRKNRLTALNPLLDDDDH